MLVTCVTACLFSLLCISQIRFIVAYICLFSFLGLFRDFSFSSIRFSLGRGAIRTMEVHLGLTEAPLSLIHI